MTFVVFGYHSHMIWCWYGQPSHLNFCFDVRFSQHLYQFIVPVLVPVLVHSFQCIGPVDLVPSPFFVASLELPDLSQSLSEHLISGLAIVGWKRDDRCKRGKGQSGRVYVWRETQVTRAATCAKQAIARAERTPATTHQKNKN